MYQTNGMDPQSMQRIYGVTQPINLSSIERPNPKMGRGEIQVLENKRRARKGQNFSNPGRK